MSTLSYNLLRTYYTNNPLEFIEILNGNSSLGKVYKDLLIQIVSSLQSELTSGSAKVVRLDFDGNIMFSNNDAYFGQTKADVKSLGGKVQKVGLSEFLIADALGKKAIIVETNVTSFVNAIKSLYIDEVSQTDNEFINNVFNNSNITGGNQMFFNVSRVIWEYDSDKYITSFGLVPVTKQVKICDDAIRDSFTFIRQGETVEWVNESSRPISIYSGTTNYDQFQLDPDLGLYGGDYHSTVLQPGDTYSYKFVTIGESDWFTYPDILTGKVSITKNRVNDSDQFLITENDNITAPFSSRVIKIDAWGNVLWSFGEGYMVKPRNAGPLLNNNVIVST